MYHPTVEELNKTPWEKQMAQQMTLDNSGVTLSYRNVLYKRQLYHSTTFKDFIWGYGRLEQKSGNLFAVRGKKAFDIVRG